MQWEDRLATWRNEIIFVASILPSEYTNGLHLYRKPLQKASKPLPIVTMKCHHRMVDGLLTCDFSGSFFLSKLSFFFAPFSSMP